jgi:hypothetical protein
MEMPLLPVRFPFLFNCTHRNGSPMLDEGDQVDTEEQDLSEQDVEENEVGEDNANNQENENNEDNGIMMMNEHELHNSLRLTKASLKWSEPTTL